MNDSIDASEERYRDWGIFHYWFRGVEKFAPWVRKVYFVTWRHLPEWQKLKGDFDAIRTELQTAFDQVLPERSSFERKE